VPALGQFTADLQGLGAGTYNTALAHSNTLAASIANGRVTLILPDGTTVIDTSKGAANTWANDQAKLINENLDSRLSVLSSQLFTCGVAIERKLSTATGFFEHVLSVRLGDEQQQSVHQIAGVLEHLECGHELAQLACAAAGAVQLE
jgi:hypothetical protein